MNEAEEEQREAMDMVWEAWQDQDQDQIPDLIPDLIPDDGSRASSDATGHSQGAQLQQGATRSRNSSGRPSQQQSSQGQQQGGQSDDEVPPLVPDLSSLGRVHTQPPLNAVDRISLPPLGFLRNRLRNQPPTQQQEQESDVSDEEVPPLVDERTAPRGRYPTSHVHQPQSSPSSARQRHSQQVVQLQQSAGASQQGMGSGAGAWTGVSSSQQQQGTQQQHQQQQLLLLQAPLRLQVPPPLPLLPSLLPVGYSPGASTMAPSLGGDESEGEYDTSTSTAWTPASVASGNRSAGTMLMTPTEVPTTPSALPVGTREEPTSMAAAAATSAPCSLSDSSSSSSSSSTAAAQSAAAQGSDCVNSSSTCSAEPGSEECWVCFTAGPLPAQHEGDTSGHIFQPCTVCTGGLRYMHRSCMQRWLASSWSVACPNCARPYAR
jgi:hypothetical protein